MPAVPAVPDAADTADTAGATDAAAATAVAATAAAATAVANLVGRYAECIDAGDYAGAGRLLAHAGVGGEEGALLRGEDAVAGLFTATARRYGDGTPRTKHVTTNLIVEVEDGAREAAARSYFTVFQATAEFPLQPILCGRYRDRFEYVDGAWRFAERRFAIDLVGDVSHHMLANVPQEPGDPGGPSEPGGPATRS